MDYESYKLNQGKIIIAISNKNLSIGYLELDPESKLDKHSRPVAEQLYQIIGTTNVIIFDDNGNTKEVILKEGEQLDVKENQHHIHENRSEEKSVTMWKFEGNISEVINNIRKSYNEIN